MVQLIDFLGRFLTVKAILNYLLDGANQIVEVQQRQIELEVQKFKEGGMSQKEAEVWALWTLNYLDTMPNKILPLIDKDNSK